MCSANAPINSASRGWSISANLRADRPCPAGAGPFIVSAGGAPRHEFLGDTAIAQDFRWVRRQFSDHPPGLAHAVVGRMRTSAPNNVRFVSASVKPGCCGHAIV
jgi:hypothetical protein